MKRLRKFRELSIQEKILLAEAVLFLFGAKILLLVLPFKLCIKTLSTGQYEDTKINSDDLFCIKKVVQLARWIMIWKNRCIVTCIAIRWMLQRRRIPSQLSLGVAFDENKKLKAHAWIKVDEFQIVEKGGNYFELFNY